MFGTPVHVIVAHNGQGTYLTEPYGDVVAYTAAEETPLDRELQSKELARIVSSVYPEPLIYLGYVVTKPHADRRTSMFSLPHTSRAHGDP